VKTGTMILSKHSVCVTFDVVVRIVEVLSCW